VNIENQWTIDYLFWGSDRVRYVLMILAVFGMGIFGSLATEAALVGAKFPTVFLCTFAAISLISLIFMLNTRQTTMNFSNGEIVTVRKFAGYLISCVRTNIEEYNFIMLCAQNGNLGSGTVKLHKRDGKKLCLTIGSDRNCEELAYRLSDAFNLPVDAIRFR
jgi:hypothetical protein